MATSHEPLIVEEQPVPHNLEQPIDSAETSLALANDAVIEPEGRPNWFRRNLNKLSAAAFVGGIAVSTALSPIGQIEHELVQSAPVAGAALATTEGMFATGIAMMAVGAGKKIGNPLKLRSRWPELSQSVTENDLVRRGFIVNALGAFGTAGVVAAGAAIALPPETWPGAFGIAAADMASTAAIRAGAYSAIKKSHAEKAEREKSTQVTVRHAELTDIDALADLDLLLFDKAYGSAKPSKEEVVEGFTKRFQNAPGWMFVAERNGAIEGFVTAFKTDKSVDDFQSWEDSTANGTLEGKVNPRGKYAYVANMTIKHESVALGAEDMLLANLFANAIHDGVEYGYFVARMPHFKRWLEDSNVEVTPENKQELAEQYFDLRREEDGKRFDPQLRMYEGYGFKPQRMVAEAFEDDASLNYGVVFLADVPPAGKLKQIKPLRVALGGALRRIAKNPTLLKKVF